MRGIFVMLRRLRVMQSCTARSSTLSETLIMSSIATVSYSSLVQTQPLFNSIIAPVSSTNFQSAQRFIITRNLSTSSSSGPSNVVLIESEEQFNNSLRKVQDECLAAIFYFTAVWCGPCRLLSPLIGQLSEKYPHVTTYKIDIDQEGLGSALSKLNIHSVIFQITDAIQEWMHPVT